MTTHAHNSKPKIGYTTRNYAWDPLQWLIDIAIRLAGGVPVRIYPKNPRHDTNLSGLIIAGGTDVDPSLFDLTPKENYVYDPDRDALEIEWLRRADVLNMPVLGICRGAQILNVMRGGSLHLDIEKSHEGAKYPSHLLANIFFRKDITIHDDSLLARLLGGAHARVNSMHKQAIDRTGRGLSICAQESNGVVQAVEDPDHSFMLGVQFHPEAMIYKAKYRNIFNGLISAARDFQSALK